MHKTQNSWLAHSYVFFSFLYAWIIIQNSGGARIIVIQNSSFSEENIDCSPLCLLPHTEKHSLSAEIDTLSLYIFQRGQNQVAEPVGDVVVMTTFSERWCEQRMKEWALLFMW